MERKNSRESDRTVVDAKKHVSYITSRSPPGGSALCIVHPIPIALAEAGLAWPAAWKPDRQGRPTFFRLFENRQRNQRNCPKSAASPIDSGSASEAPLRPLPERPGMPQRRARWPAASFPGRRLPWLNPVSCTACPPTAKSNFGRCKPAAGKVGLSRPLRTLRVRRFR
jgi:hypothetical protein